MSFVTGSHFSGFNGPLARYVKLRVAHAPGMPKTFPPLPQFSDPDMHHGTCVTHVPWCMPGSLTSSFLWIWWRGKHSRRMRNPRFCVSGKRPIYWRITCSLTRWADLCTSHYESRCSLQSTSDGVTNAPFVNFSVSKFVFVFWNLLVSVRLIQSHSYLTVAELWWHLSNMSIIFSV